MPPYGYFGPPGTFSHQALLTLPALGPEPIPYATVGQALQAVRSGEIAAALVPIENSVEGGVSATLDNLTYGDPLVITREVVLPVQFSLYGRPGTRLDGRTPHPHPPARRRAVPGLAGPEPAGGPVTEGGSTAAAAAEVADPLSRFDAAICAPVAGELHGLSPLAEGIADNPDAVTRFVRGVQARPGRPADRRGQDHDGAVHAGEPPGRAAGDPRAVRQPGGQPVPDRVAAHQDASSATTASPSTPRATSTTPGWPRR